LLSCVKCIWFDLTFEYHEGDTYHKVANALQQEQVQRAFEKVYGVDELVH
jgi:hypothetical protein